MDAWNETTHTLVAKLSKALERELNPFEIALIDWVITHIRLQELEEKENA
jgi:hypothetical protein